MKAVTMLRFDDKGQEELTAGRRGLLANRILVLEHKKLQVPQLLDLMFANSHKLSEGAEACDWTEITWNPHVNARNVVAALLKVDRKVVKPILQAAQEKSDRGNRKGFDSVVEHVNAVCGGSFDYKLYTKANFDSDADLRAAIAELVAEEPVETAEVAEVADSTPEARKPEKSKK